MAGPGRVSNRAAQDLPRAAYDFVVLGGGLIGTACTYFLREFAPESSVLLVEAGGIPSEDGATHVAPALHHHWAANRDAQARLRWFSEFLRKVDAERGGRAERNPVFARVGFLLRLDPGEGEDAGVAFADWRAAQSNEVRQNVEALFGFADDARVRFDPAGGYGNAEALALHLGHAAVARGADLVLNARASFRSATDLCLDRLEMNNRMELKIVRQTQVRASRAVIVACGARSARLIRDGLGAAAPIGSRYVQFPRFENDPDLRRDARGVTAMPVVAADGFAIRPHGDGALLVPPPLRHADPDEYQPTGGKFHGVAVGLRQELLDTLLDRLERLPALSRPSLNLGKTPANLRGAWEAVTPNGGSEIWQVPGAAVWLLAAGGAQGFSGGVGVACELAHRLSATAAPLPWQC